MRGLDVASRGRYCQDWGSMKETPKQDPLPTPEDSANTPAQSPINAPQARWSETRELLQRALQEWDSTVPTAPSPVASHPQPEKLEELFKQLQAKLKDLS